MHNGLSNATRDLPAYLSARGGGASTGDVIELTDGAGDERPEIYWSNRILSSSSFHVLSTGIFYIK